MFGLPIKKLACALIPLGYEVDPDNKEMLRPIDRELRLLYKARCLRKRSTLASTAAWLTKQLDKKVSTRTLNYIFANRPPLKVYELPLDERLLIATSASEQTVLDLCPEGRKTTNRSREAYYKRREEAVRRKEEERRSPQRTEQSIS